MLLPDDTKLPLVYLTTCAFLLTDSCLQARRYIQSLRKSEKQDFSKVFIGANPQGETAAGGQVALHDLLATPGGRNRAFSFCRQVASHLASSPRGGGDRSQSFPSC